MEPKSILFVDDEQNILNALQRVFRKSDHHIFVANSAWEGLKQLSKNKIDILVTDYKMPGMDGYALCKMVKEKYPHIVRIMLSGYSTDKIILKALFEGTIRLFLTKPWDDDFFRNYIDRLVRLDATLENPQLKAYIHNLSHFPGVPDIYNKLIKAVDEEKHMKYIAEIIEEDPALSAKILQIINSGAYGLQSVSIQRAILFLGVEALRDLSISCSIFRDLRFPNELKGLAELLWQHSQLCNNYLQRIYQSVEKNKLPSRLTSIGLLANIGFFLFLQNFPTQFPQYLNQLKNYHGTNYEEIDTSLFQITHSSIGSYLFHWWNMPYETVEIIVNHHSAASETGQEFIIANALALADVIAWKELGYLSKMKIINPLIDKLFTAEGNFIEELQSKNVSLFDACLPESATATDSIACGFDETGLGPAPETVSEKSEAHQGGELAPTMSVPCPEPLAKGTLPPVLTPTPPPKNEPSPIKLAKTVLFVDDEENVLSSLRRGLRTESYKQLFAASPKEALTILDREEVQVIMADMRMPEMTGLQLFKITKQKYPQTINIILSGHSHISMVIAAINSGDVFRYIMKPWDIKDDIIPAINQAFQIYEENEKKDLRIRELEQKVLKLETRLKELEDDSTR
jgi:YesN/AraC family two-component response regulator